MIHLYKLMIYDILDDGHREGFHIGVFRTEAEAQAAASRYLSGVKGFCEFECEAEILPSVLFSEGLLPEVVWSWSGWNWDENGGESDILEGPFFSSEEEAASDMALAQQKSDRAEWCCERFVVGQCDWAEGFVRYGYNA